MVSDEWYVICDSGVGEDVAHFLVGCVEFERDWLVLLDDVCRIVGPESGWINFGEWTTRERWHCCRKKVEGICNRVIEGRVHIVLVG